MAFTFDSGTDILTQTDTDTSLAGIPNDALTSTIIDGLITIYQLSAGVRLVIDGSLDINPEREQLSGDAVNLIFVSVGATLKLGGVDESTINGILYRRLQRGVAIRNDENPTNWAGFSFNLNTRRDRNTILVNGTLIIQGATLEFPGNFFLSETSSCYIEDGTLIPKEYTSAEETSLGLRDQGGGALAADRGFISNWFAADASINGYTLLGGGEVSFRSFPDSSLDSSVGEILTLDGMVTPKRGITGFAPLHANYPVFSSIWVNASDLDGAAFKNISVANRGNAVDVILRSFGTTQIGGTKLTNSDAGTSAFVAGSFDHATLNNWGVASIHKEVNFNLTDFEGKVVSGGRVFSRDTDNGLRTELYIDGSDITKIANTSTPRVDFASSLYNDINDYVYSNTFNSGSLDVPLEVQLGSVKMAVPAAVVQNNTSNDPSNTDPLNALSRYDLRGETNVLGEDTHTFHIWHPEYLYTPVTQSLADGAEPRIIDLALAEDMFWGNTQFSNSEITTLSGIYDYIKQTKSSSATEMELPSISTLHIEGDSRTLELGDYSMMPGNVAYLEVDTANSVITVNTVMLDPTDIFNGISTTGNLDVDLLNQSETYFLTANVLFEVDDFDAFPPNWTLNGTIHFDDGATKILTFDPTTDTSDIELLRTAGNVTVRNKIATSFAKVTGTISFEVGVTLSADHVGDIVLHNVSSDTYTHYLSTDTVLIYGVAGAQYRAIVTSRGRAAAPIEFSVGTVASTVELRSRSLEIVGYDPTADIDISGSRIFTIPQTPETIDAGRDILFVTQNGGRFNYSDSALNNKWFGDLYGARNTADTENLMGEIILRNWDLTKDTEIFSLNPVSLVVAVNLPLVRAIYGNNPDEFRFRANPFLAKRVNVDYIFTNAVLAQVSFNEAGSVTDEANSVGVIAAALVDTSASAVTTLIDTGNGTSANTRNLISFEIEQQTRLGV